jgi:hypothetical protein
MVVLESSSGVRQGDPIGPFCWSVGARKQLEYVASSVPGITISAYLDDVSVLGSRPGLLREVAQALQDAPVACRAVQLNLSKSSEHTLDEIRQSGLRVLGTCIGSETARREFLSEKIAKELRLLELLPDLPHQYGLLLLRFSVQQNLRHLARCLDPSGLWDLWSDYDRALHATVARFRDSPRCLPTDTALFSLPVRMGGLGVPAMLATVPAARLAMTELSAWVNGHRSGATAMGPRPPRQRSYMQSQYDQMQADLYRILSDSDRLLVADACSSVGSRWLSTIPYFSTLRLSNAAVASALHYRTLCPGSAAICMDCAQDNLPGHDELCAGRKNWRLARHEVVKKTLVSHLRSVDNTLVHVEPFVPGTDMRTDFRVSGPAAPSGTSAEFDLTIVAPTSVDALRVPIRVSAHCSNKFIQGAVKDRLVTYLRDVSDAKRRKYGGKTASRFVPLAMTSGGTLSSASLSTFKHWRSLPGATFPFLLSHLSVLLVRARAEHFRF